MKSTFLVARLPHLELLDSGILYSFSDSLLNFFSSLQYNELVQLVRQIVLYTLLCNLLFFPFFTPYLISFLYSKSFLLIYPANHQTISFRRTYNFQDGAVRLESLCFYRPAKLSGINPSVNRLVLPYISMFASFATYLER